eukprot:8465565-Karenia_brevis.AAC.1
MYWDGPQKYIEADLEMYWDGPGQGPGPSPASDVTLDQFWKLSLRGRGNDIKTHSKKIPDDPKIIAR